MKNDLKNAVNKEYSKISVPTNKLDQALNHAMEYEEKSAFIPIWHKLKIPLLAFSAACVMLFGLLFTSPTVADVLKNLPIVESAFFNKGDQGHQAAYDEEKIQVINQTEENNDLKIRITEAYYDDVRFSVGYEIIPLREDITKDAVWDYVINNKFYINDQEAQISYGTNLSNDTSTSIRGILEFDPKKSLMKDQFDFKVEFQGTEKINEELNFEFPVYYVEREGSSNQGVTLESQKGKFSVRNVVKTPSGIMLDTNFNYPVDEKQQRLPITYYISSGNGLWFEPLERKTVHESNKYYHEKFDSFYEKFSLEFPPLENEEQFNIIPAITQQAESKHYRIYEGAQFQTEYGSFEIDKLDASNESLSLDIMIDDESTYLPVDQMWILNSKEPIASLNSIKHINGNRYRLTVDTDEKVSELSLEVYPIKPLDEMKIKYSLE